MQTNKRSALYTLARWIYSVCFYLLFRGHVEGREHIPPEGAVVLMSNHIHALDPLTVAMCVPRRQLHFVAKKELFEKKLFSRVLRALHAIPVGRGEFDLAAMRESLAVLHAGEVLAIFPEGHRCNAPGELGELHSGSALLALRSAVPVIPVYIVAPPRLFRRQRIRIGAPIDTADLRARGVDNESATLLVQRMREALLALRAR